MDDNNNNIIKTDDINMQQQSSTTSAPSSSNSDHDSTTPTVTSSSPTPSSSAFQPYQFHEAMLAAVNSHGVASLSQHGLIAAVAAAVGASTAAAAAAAAAAVAATTNNNHNTTPSPNTTTNIIDSTTSSPFQQPQPQITTPQRQPSVIDIAKRDSIRAANRERKKKWRIHNEERNKDNDLRCRVNKRATKLYGAADTEEKRAWANEEFEKRRQKRMEKERRKNMIDNVLSVPGSPSNGVIVNGATTASSTTISQQQQQLTSQDLTQPPTSAAATATVEGLPEQMAYYPPMTVDQSAAAKMLDFPPELQRQLLEQLNNMITLQALTNGGKLPTPPGEFGDQPDQEQPPSHETPSFSEEQTHHLQPAEQSSTHITSQDLPPQPQPLQDSASEHEMETLKTEEEIQHHGIVNQDIAMEEQPLVSVDNLNDNNNLASVSPVLSGDGDVVVKEEQQGLSTSTSVSDSVQNSPQVDKMDTNQEELGTAIVTVHDPPNMDIEQENPSQDLSSSSTPSQQHEEKKPEYPLDAVLTLMQLNAGWRE